MTGVAMTFGEKLKELRMGAGLSFTELANACGLSRVTILDYEGNRRTPTLESAQKLAKALGIEVTAFNDVEFQHATQKHKRSDEAAD